jgi:diadenosine tetraphosphate (Ap4A) HIT family hydrolase
LDALPTVVSTDAVSELQDWKRDRIGSANAGTNPTVLARLPHSFAVIGDTQFLPGYCVLLVDDPSVDRLTDLPKAERVQFLDSMDTLGQAVETACRATDAAFRRMNYEILGNTYPHLHAHLFPRYDWEPPERIGGPAWLYDPETFYSPEAALAPRHDDIRARIVAELVRLGATH